MFGDMLNVKDTTRLEVRVASSLHGLPVCKASAGSSRARGGERRRDEVRQREGGRTQHLEFGIISGLDLSGPVINQFY